MLIDIIISNISVSFWCLCFFFLSWKIFRIIYPPFDFPKNIPTIPFYAAFVSSFLGWDQNKVYAHYYRENLEKYGAAKIYFASRWNILVTKPEYLAQIFKQNEIFEKSGNQHKIPYSLLAEYTGDNIISTGNKYWKLYRKAVTNSIQFPNLEPLQTNATALIENLSAAADNGYFPIADKLQAYTLNNVGDCVIGTNFHKSDNFDIYTSLKKVKQEIFRPLFLNFPLLDLLPFPSRIRARKMVRSFKRNYCNKILNELNEENKGRLGYNLATFWKQGDITEKQFQDNAMIAMIAGHENPQLLLTSLIYVIAKYPEIQRQLRSEINSSNYDVKEQIPLLKAVVYETIRLFPPLGLIVNRKTRRNVILGNGIFIPKGTYVGYNNFGTQRDRNYWGDDADAFRPERWGNDGKKVEEKYAEAKSNCTLPAFHGRSRACLGEKFALAEVRKAMIEILQNFEISLDPSWKEQLTPAGPICPSKLSVMLKKVCSEHEHNI